MHRYPFYREVIAHSIAKDIEKGDALLGGSDSSLAMEIQILPAGAESGKGVEITRIDGEEIRG